MKAPPLENKIEKRKEGAQVTMMLWLGSERDYMDIPKTLEDSGGDLITNMEIVRSVVGKGVLCLPGLL